MTTISAAEAARGFGLDKVLEQLSQVASFFGAGELGDEVGEVAAEVADKEIDWAANTKSDWVESAPWATGNLRDSIDVDASDFPKSMTVGVDRDKLLSRAGQNLFTIRKGYSNKKSKIPDFDYTEAIDEGRTINGDKYSAVSASKTVDPIQPTIEREYAHRIHTPFIREIWFELAKKNKKEIFGNA